MFSPVPGEVRLQRSERILSERKTVQRRRDKNKRERIDAQHTEMVIGLWAWEIKEITLDQQQRMPGKHSPWLLGIPAPLTNLTSAHGRNPQQHSPALSV